MFSKKRIERAWEKHATASHFPSNDLAAFLYVTDNLSYIIVLCTVDGHNHRHKKGVDLHAALGIAFLVIVAAAIIIVVVSCQMKGDMLLSPKAYKPLIYVYF